MKFVVSGLVGLILGATGTLIHNLWPPLGLLTAIVGTFVGIRYLGQFYFDRFGKVIAVMVWALVVARASTIGNGDELLITGSISGTIFVFLGLASALIAMSLKP